MEDSTYEDMKRGLLDENRYQRRIRRLRDARDEYTEQFERLSQTNSETSAAALEKMFELATREPENPELSESGFEIWRARIDDFITECLAHAA